MKFLGHLACSFVGNIIALLVTAQFVDGFALAPGVRNLLLAAGILTVIMVIARPILKVILSPLIILTLGLFSLVINAALLLALDFYSDSVSISGLEPLVVATLIITAITIFVHAVWHKITFSQP